MVGHTNKFTITNNRGKKRCCKSNCYRYIGNYIVYVEFYLNTDMSGGECM